MSGDYDLSLFWPAYKAAGMLLEAQTVLPNHQHPTVFDVRFQRPDLVLGNGASTTEYEMVYQRCDAPTLREGADVIIGPARADGHSDVIEGGTLYRVREDPYVEAANGGASGFFWTARLTRAPTECKP